jgi:hypothetical protein
MPQSLDTNAVQDNASCFWMPDRAAHLLLQIGYYWGAFFHQLLEIEKICPAESAFCEVIDQNGPHFGA